MAIEPKILNKEELSQEFVRLLRNVPHDSDPLVIILKAHLLFEDLLYRFIEQKSIRPHILKHARLRFEQLVYLAESFSESNIEEWQWASIKKLNSLRNTLAHNLDSSKFLTDLNQFTNHIFAHEKSSDTFGLLESGLNRNFIAIFVLHTIVSHSLLAKYEFPSLLSVLFNESKEPS